MKVLWAGAVVLNLIAVPAHAEARYDRKLEQAAVEIVAGRIGGIRGGFSYDAKPPVIVRPQAESGSGHALRGGYSALDPWRDGLAPAIERKLRRNIF